MTKIIKYDIIYLSEILFFEELYFFEGDVTMKFSKKIAALLSLSTAVTVLASSAVSTASGTSVDDGNDDWLHAVGSRLYDENGNEVWLTGANWFGFNCSENCAHGLYATDCDAFLSSVAEKGINLIRFPISTELIYSWMKGSPNAVSSVQASYSPPKDVVGEDGTVTKAGTYGNINKDFVLDDGKTLKDSMQIFDVVMQKCKKYGIKAMIDIHSPDANNSGHNYELWFGKETAAGSTMVTTDVWMDTLTWLADKYKNDDTIVGFDLKNEPHGKRGYTGTTCPSTIAKWDGSKDENNWAYASTQCANKILAVNPNALIFIEGVEQYPKTAKGNTYDTPDIWQASADVSPWFGAWWGGNLRGVKDFPVKPDSGTSQIVYSPHDYGPSVYAQSWFNKDFTTQTLLDDYWYDTWAYINAENIAPLLIGEWGGYMDGGDNQKWMELLRDYMINHHISHTFWCLNPNSGDTGGLLSYDFKTWDTDKYSLFEKSLWQTQKTGLYIGLDHQTPLGTSGTGLSLSQFYSSYSSTEGSNLDGGTIAGSSTTKPTSATTASDTTTSTKATSVTTKTTTVTASKSNISYGDVNCDGKVDISDVVAIRRFLVNSSKFKITDQGVLNGDVQGKGDGLNAQDAVAVQQYVFSVVTTLPL